MYNASMKTTVHLDRETAPPFFP